MDIRELTQQDGWKTQNDEKMSRKIGNAQSHATFFRHSAVLSLPAVLLRKLPIVRIVFEFRVIAFGGWRT